MLDKAYRNRFSFSAGKSCSNRFRYPIYINRHSSCQYYDQRTSFFIFQFYVPSSMLLHQIFPYRNVLMIITKNNDSHMTTNNMLILRSHYRIPLTLTTKSYLLVFGFVKQKDIISLYIKHCALYIYITCTSCINEI